MRGNKELLPGLQRFLAAEPKGSLGLLSAVSGRMKAEVSCGNSPSDQMPFQVFHCSSSSKAPQGPACGAAPGGAPRSPPRTAAPCSQLHPLLSTSSSWPPSPVHPRGFASKQTFLHVSQPWWPAGCGSRRGHSRNKPRRLPAPTPRRQAPVPGDSHALGHQAAPSGYPIFGSTECTPPAPQRVIYGPI